MISFACLTILGQNLIVQEGSDTGSDEVSHASKTGSSESLQGDKKKEMLTISFSPGGAKTVKVEPNKPVLGAIQKMCSHKKIDMDKCFFKDRAGNEIKLDWNLLQSDLTDLFIQVGMFMYLFSLKLEKSK